MCGTEHCTTITTVYNIRPRLPESTDPATFSNFLPAMRMIRAPDAMQDTQKPPVSSTADLQREVAELMIESLNLDTTATEIDPDAPLYGDGLGLDSIDVL